MPLEVTSRIRIAGIVPRTARPFGLPLLQVRRRAAHEVLDCGHTRGKIVLCAGAGR